MEKEYILYNAVQLLWAHYDDEGSLKSYLTYKDSGFDI